MPLARRLRLPLELIRPPWPLLLAGIMGANIIGAGVVFAFIVWIFPLPPVDDPETARLVNALVFAGFLPFVIVIGIGASLHRFRPILVWLIADRPATVEEQRTVLRAPLLQVRVNAALWGVGVVVFTGLNLGFSFRLAVLVAITVTLGTATTCAVGYLLAERILRGVARRALTAGVPTERAGTGVTARVMLTWGASTGVPALGITLVSIAELTGVLSTTDDSSTREQLAATALFLGGIGLIVGLIATFLLARSLSDPIETLRRALDRVRRGDIHTEVEVYDGSEIGLLQAGFNEMVEGVREREQLRDLFGRQVGEDVARQALERGVVLGGEQRDVAVLFIDLVGSTQLAATRPPAEVVDVLNELFRVVVAVVAEHGGSVNKFEGDAALCVFGAPLDTPDPAGSALASARMLRARLEDELPEQDIGIGVSAGPAVAGNVGAAERFEYTVIGDPVNEAARLTELAKTEPGRVLASGEAVARAGAGERRWWAVGEEHELRGRVAPTLLARPVG